jgi:rSAM/selenodomain-associated transferase 2
MQVTRFMILGVVWLADMAWMVAIAPLGEHPLLFSVLFGLGHLLMIFLVRLFPKNFSPPKAFTAIFIIGILGRFVFLSYPVGNDIFRYVWEGFVQTQGFNPFTYAPDNPVLADIARGQLAPIWRQINHPGLSAAYPPFSLLLFRMLASFTQDPLWFKAAMIGFDIGLMIVVMLIISRLGVPPSRLLLYAANPLILVYITGEGHLDVIQAFFLSLAIYLIICKKYHATGFLMLGMAIATKYFALIAWPFLVNAENRIKSLAVLIPLILYLPFIDAGIGIFQSLGIFTTHFSYNDSLTVFMRLIFGEMHHWVTAFLLIICLAWVYMFVQDAMRSVYLACGCLLLFLPTLHPWYLVLIVPFLSFFPSRAWLYLQAAVLFTFPVTAVEFKTGGFQEIHWLKLMEYIPFYGLLVLGLFRNGYSFSEKYKKRPESISVVIPSLNEADLLGQCLQSLQNRTGLKDIIVADGGSTDETREIAMKAGAIVVESSKGRGLQIEKGIKATSADVIIVMHADCEAKRGVFERILKILEENPHAAGGAVGMQFKQKKLRTRVVAALNNLRALLTGVSFGDQAQFFRSEALDAVGGFPSMMLMEDVELSLRLKEVGGLVFLSDGILVSGRRWQGNHFSYNLMTVFHLFPRYLIERRFRRTDRIYRQYYDAYYPDNSDFQ